MDYDTLNTIHREERGYQEWVRERKNQILAMTNTVKKQEAWNKLFPPMPKGDYLAGNLF